MTTPAYSPIEAAGAVLWRIHEGVEEVALVHRPAYDDWSLPKGKGRRGEHPLVVALREVHEETGYRGLLGLPLPDQRYLKEDRPKVVHLHAMQALQGEPLDPDVEVDAVSWLPLAAAAGTATWERDRISLMHFAGLHRPTSVVMLLRHASAGERRQWDGPDEERPLDEYGETQAAALSDLLPAFDIRRVVSSPTVRCRQTVEGFAAGLGVPLETDPAVAEDDYRPEAAEELIEELIAAPKSSVLCTHGPVLADLVERLTSRLGWPPTGAARVPKGGAWLVHTDRAGQVVGLERMASP
ncbi:MAG: 8-oxo-(d)GTP phosphatase [Frankiales bacterium]|jgi:8-oxo-dGTP diphosphatase|nr:8-oxo-(d)GTP phosphatase [Frankiales bacterium]MDX6274992.1 8-oxo-(d)GTP phosphatase [Frankiales bacterium]